MLGLPAYKSAPTLLEKAKIPTTKQTRKGWSSVRYLGVFLYQSEQSEQGYYKLASSFHIRLCTFVR